MKRTDSLVCVGLDLIEELLPIELNEKFSNQEDKFFYFLTTVINITASQTFSYKIQKAFLDKYIFGHSLLKRILEYGRFKYPNKVFIVDCKIGDVAHTLGAYSQNLFDLMGADGIVVNPYMGEDVFDFCNDKNDKLFFMLVRTSNEGGKIIQDLMLKNNKHLWEHILDLICERWERTKNCIPILSLDRDEDIKKVRKIIPNDMPVFWAGYGMQKRTPIGLNSILDKHGYGVIVNSSRDILYTEFSNHSCWEAAILENMTRTRHNLNQLKNS